ncbi:uncharacterized protein LOC134287819 [Aedes albopictus]|uniref:Endonuclease/exonuclease/phosphatase domain-containing protein n=1 Tax=Aedes albopictus TaxID=7160 RepID=A0ABM1YFQ4_AEDAL
MTGIEAVACEVTIRGKTLSVASIYLPPRTAISRRDLAHICSVMPEPRLLMGDFNSHGTGWGELYDDSRSTLIYDLCDDFNMTILNTGEVTRVAPPAKDGSPRDSRLDLSICSSSLSLECTWKVIQDPHGSDHLPIVVSISNGSRQPPSIDISYDLTKHIDWGKYAEAIIDGEQSVEILPPREEYQFLSELIISSALQAQRRPVPGPSARRKPPNPWWDSECTEIYREKSAAFKEFRKRGSVENFKRYQKAGSRGTLSSIWDICAIAKITAYFIIYLREKEGKRIWMGIGTGREIGKIPWKRVLTHKRTTMGSNSALKRAL